MQGIREPRAIEQAIMIKIEERPNQVRNKDGFQPAFGKLPKIKSSFDIQIVEQAKGRDEEEDRYAEPCECFQQSYQMDIGSRVHDILGADMDADDPQHGNAAYVFNSGKPRFAGQGCCLHKLKTPR